MKLFLTFCVLFFYWSLWFNRVCCQKQRDFQSIEIVADTNKGGGVQEGRESKRKLLWRKFAGSETWFSSDQWEDKPHRIQTEGVN
jgi:hypothetical protein